MYVAWKEALKENYDYFIWLNDDTFIKADCFERLLNASNIFENKAIIVGTTCAKGDSKKITYGGRDEKERLIENTNDYNKCYTFNGNIVLVPQYVVNKMGIISSKFHHRFGDTEYGFRANREGIEIRTALGVLGECDLHSSVPAFCDPSKKLSLRLKSYLSVTGGAPRDLFYLRLRYFGFFAALLTLFSSFIHTLFPRIWKGKESLFNS
jgi:GT2 family glycosyltransferase